MRGEELPGEASTSPPSGEASVEPTADAAPPLGDVAWDFTHECPACGQIVRYEGGQRVPAGSTETAHADVTAILDALGLGTYARPYSMHEVVQREILPALDRIKGGA
jgi:hypothetical protein